MFIDSDEENNEEVNENSDDEHSAEPGSAACPAIQIDQPVRVGRQTKSTARNKPLSDADADAIGGWSDMDDDPYLPLFEGCPGVKVDIDEDSTPYDAFKIFFGNDIVRLIKEETNRYARQQINKLISTGKMKPQSLYKNWKPITIADINNFFAVILHMCLVNKPNIKHYWSTSCVLNGGFPSSVMSRNRFCQIFGMLHLNNNELFKPKPHPEHDPLFKIRPYYDKLRTLFQESYHPEQEITIDEGMCPFRGRVHFRVYMKNKPHKYGMKFFVLAEACSGYSWNFELLSR